jgi:hypothetical protein
MRRETNGHDPLQSGKTIRGSADATPASTPNRSTLDNKPYAAFQSGTATTPVVLDNLIAAATVPFTGATQNKIILAKNRGKSTRSLDQNDLRALVAGKPNINR